MIAKVLLRGSLAALVALAVVQNGAAQEPPRVYRALSVADTEALLREINVEPKKSASPDGKTNYFDYKKNGYEIRISNFDGKDLMIDCLFKPLPLDKVNQWNVKTKFSRASLQKGKENDITVLEWNLDLLGGVTKDSLKQFVNQFDFDLKDYDKFITDQGGGGSGVPSAPVSEKIIAKVDDASIERVLNGLKLPFTKNEQKNITTYDYDQNNFKLKLYNYGGFDLMIDAQFKAIPLTQVNTYNLNRKFVRAVLYQGKNRSYTALETNLDCVAGVSESIIRNFITAFNEDVKHFQNFVKDVKE